MPFILTNTRSTINFEESGDELFVGRGATLYYDLFSPTVFHFADVNRLTVQVEGVVASQEVNAIVLYKDSAGAGNNTVVIGADGAAYCNRDYVSVFLEGTGNAVQNFGLVSGGGGVWGSGWSNGTIENDGTVAGLRFAGVKLLDGSGDTRIINGGLITGAGGVVLENDSATVINVAGGEIRSNAVAVAAVDASLGAVRGLTLRNDGELTAVGTAVQGSNLADTVVNRGVMNGDVLLGAGNDLFNGRRGTLDGILRGGDGNDTLLAGAGAGGDTIYGDFGADRLEGGAGDDLLYGGGSRDVFAFSRGTGNDVVADFQDAADDLDLSLLRFASFAAVSALATNVTGGLLLDLTSRGGGTVFVQGFTKAQFDATDVVL